MQTNFKIAISIISILTLWGCDSRGIPENYSAAHLRKTGEKFTLTITGKRFLHPAGPFDIGKTYEDSIEFLIPADSGLIKVEDLPQDSCCYPRFGTIRIEGAKVGVNVYAHDTDAKKIDTFSWNGKYDLIRTY